LYDFLFHDTGYVNVWAYGGRVQLLAQLVPGEQRIGHAELYVMNSTAHPDAAWPEARYGGKLRGGLPNLCAQGDPTREFADLAAWIGESWPAWTRRVDQPDGQPEFIEFRVDQCFSVYRDDTRQDDRDIAVWWTVERGPNGWVGRGPVRIHVYGPDTVPATSEDGPEPDPWVQVRRTWVHNAAQLINLGRGMVRGAWAPRPDELN
jgi:hypothetical protein